MKLFSGITAIFILLNFYPHNIFSQPKHFFVLKQDFIPLLDSLVTPPSNCKEALDLMMFDSVKNEFICTELLGEQDERIRKIFDDCGKKCDI